MRWIHKCPGPKREKAIAEYNRDYDASAKFYFGEEAEKVLIEEPKSQYEFRSGKETIRCEGRDFEDALETGIVQGKFKDLPEVIGGRIVGTKDWYYGSSYRALEKPGNAGKIKLSSDIWNKIDELHKSAQERVKGEI
jgi:hypothetical protein